MTICHGIPWYRNGADDHCPFIIEGWWLFFYPLSYLTLTKNRRKQALSSGKEQSQTMIKSSYMYFIHNTLGGSKESPLPRKCRAFTKVRAFLFADLPGFMGETAE